MGYPVYFFVWNYGLAVAAAGVSATATRATTWATGTASATTAPSAATIAAGAPISTAAGPTAWTARATSTGCGSATGRNWIGAIEVGLGIRVTFVTALIIDIVGLIVVEVGAAFEEDLCVVVLFTVEVSGRSGRSAAATTLSAATV